jgi:hypothetical protein
MSIQAIPLTEAINGPPSWFPVEAGQPCDLTLEIADHCSGVCVDWSGHVPRFRIYSPYVDRFVVVEITDSNRCTFEPNGIWKLHLTAEETAALPRGGLTYTLEHCDSDGNWQLAIRAGISCRDANEQTGSTRHLGGPHLNSRVNGKVDSSARVTSPK